MSHREVSDRGFSTGPRHFRVHQISEAVNKYLMDVTASKNCQISMVLHFNVFHICLQRLRSRLQFCQCISEERWDLTRDDVTCANITSQSLLCFTVANSTSIARVHVTCTVRRLQLDPRGSLLTIRPLAIALDRVVTLYQGGGSGYREPELIANA